MDEERVIAEIRDYDELVRGLRARVHELNAPCEDIDAPARPPPRGPRSPSGWDHAPNPS
jgi:hypothetical protein